MRLNKNIETIGSLLILLSVAVQFFIVDPLTSSKARSYTIEIIENQAKLHSLLDEIVSAQNSDRKVPITVFHDNRPAYYDQIDNRLDALNRQVDYASKTLLMIFLIGSLMVIIRKHQ